MKLKAYPNVFSYKLLVYLLIKFNDVSNIDRILSIENLPKDIFDELTEIKGSLLTFNNWLSKIPINFVNTIDAFLPLLNEAEADPKLYSICDRLTIKLEKPTLFTLAKSKLPSQHQLQASVSKKSIAQVIGNYSLSKFAVNALKDLIKDNSVVSSVYSDNSVKITDLLVDHVFNQSMPTEEDVQKILYVTLLFSPCELAKELFTLSDLKTYFKDKSIVNKQPFSNRDGFSFIKESLLHQMCLTPFRDQDKIELLLKNGANPNQYNEAGFTPVHYLFASANNTIKFENNFVEKYKNARKSKYKNTNDIEIQESDFSHLKFLGWASEYNETAGSSKKGLMKIDFALPTLKQGWTIWHLACRYGETKALIALLDNNIKAIKNSIQQKDIIGLNPLNHIASHYNQNTCRQMLDLISYRNLTIPSSMVYIERTKFWKATAFAKNIVKPALTMGIFSGLGLIYSIINVAANAAPDRPCINGTRQGHPWDPRVSSCNDTPDVASTPKMNFGEGLSSMSSDMNAVFAFSLITSLLLIGSLLYPLYKHNKDYSALCDEARQEYAYKIYENEKAQTSNHITVEPAVFETTALLNRLV